MPYSCFGFKVFPALAVFAAPAPPVVVVDPWLKPVPVEEVPVELTLVRVEAPVDVPLEVWVEVPVEDAPDDVPVLLPEELPEELLLLLLPSPEESVPLLQVPDWVIDW